VSAFNQERRDFEFKPGPVFANIVLGDEINRASPKTQSALLEAMEEHQVTVDANTYRLPAPFMVIATQNPIEHEGTYPLPESQVDRFLMRAHMGYPGRHAEITMLDAHGSGNVISHLHPVADETDVADMVAQAHAVFVAPALKGYIVDLAAATRAHPSLALGMSPRAALALQRAARAWAAAQGRDYVTPDDVKSLARPVLSHRLALAPDASVGGLGPEDALEEILASVPVPTGRAAQG
jgi:MoxR-like ATPase